MRFPEIYRLLNPCDVVLVPSAFMRKTGQAHWETLLKARAIENQCFVIAAAQCGTHNQEESENLKKTPRQSYGHSIAINPWGETIGEIRSMEDEGYFLVEIDT